ncbi:hypothetical protein ACN28S_28085 [Cystobacter fuscus]
MWVFAAQLLAVGLLYAVSRGHASVRPAPGGGAAPLVARVRALLGWLARRARVERELVPELGRQLRRLMHERLGISPELPEEEAARLVEQRCGLSAADYLAEREALIRTLEQRDIRPADYARLVRRYARLEALLTGRAVRPAGPS